MSSAVPRLLLPMLLWGCGGVASSTPRDGGTDGAEGSSGSSSGAMADASDADSSAPTDGGTGNDGSVLLDATCGPSNCAGCCAGSQLHPSNLCITQQSKAACGTGGDFCTTCGATNESCQNGACIAVEPNCGPKNCRGCCVDSNTCASGTTNAACGFNGDACQQCGAGTLCNWTPETLDAGVCQPPPQVCGPSNCAGCCIDTLGGYVCAVGNQSDACGLGGLGCSVCVGEVCVNGKCQ
jgi:hypothetical protein